MRYLLFIIISLSASLHNAQAQSSQSIDLAMWHGKSNDIPFKITAVQDSRENTTNIGKAYHKSKKKDIDFNFASSSEAMVLKMITRQFTQGKETDISLEIKRLKIVREKQGKSVRDRLYFDCAFNHTKSGTLLYTFNASNAVNPSKNPRLNITNYIARAITAAISNFKKDYLVHPEWHQETAAQTVKLSIGIDKKIIYNQFETSGDTIALRKGYKLNKNDFVAQATDVEKDDAYSFFEMTYQIKTIDEGKKIDLSIYPKAYFLRSKSWAKDADSVSPNWLAYQQLLYDNATLHALKFKNELAAKEYSAGYFKSQINKIYNENTRRFFDSMDLIYSETKFGQDATAVNSWIAKVSTALAATD